jgi:hypothetical protein
MTPSPRREYLYIGSCPCDEPCISVITGTKYLGGMLAQCHEYANFLLRCHGAPVGSAKLEVQTSHHEFGTYAYVAVTYDCGDPEGLAYALKCSNDSVDLWDEPAKLVMKQIKKKYPNLHWI